MTIDELTKAVSDLTRRLNLAETKLSQQAGQFEFITGQLRDVQLYMHARFDDVDLRFDRLQADVAEIKQKLGDVADIKQKLADVADIKQKMVDIAEIKQKVDALPRVIAELIAGR